MKTIDMAQCKEVGSLCICPWILYWYHIPSFSFHFASQSPCCEHFTLRHIPHHNVLLYYRHNRNIAKWLWMKTFKMLSKNELFLLLSWLSQVFCYSYSKLIH
jgi:hypothetical protein